MTSPNNLTPAHGDDERAFVPLAIRVLVVSDTRDLVTDKSGVLIEQRLADAGHRLLERRIVPDELDSIREVVQQWTADPEVEVVIVTGGTGVTTRDITPEAVEPLYDKALPGFGELFRWLSYGEIGASTIQSRASAGVVAGTLVFLMPGSVGACRLGMDEIILSQLDARTKPCSFPALLGRL